MLLHLKMYSKYTWVTNYKCRLHDKANAYSYCGKHIALPSLLYLCPSKILILKKHYLLLALQTYSPESWLWIYEISITTKPKSDTDFMRDECLMGWPLWNHSTFRCGSPTGMSVHSKWAESPSFKPSRFWKQNGKKMMHLLHRNTTIISLNFAQ
jgi:hypothetical protein